MEPQFHEWLTFFNTKDHSDNAYTDIKNFFDSGTLSVECFETSMALKKAIIKIVDMNMYTNIIRPDKEKDNVIDDKTNDNNEEVDEDNRYKSLQPSYITKQLYSIKQYTTFLGHKYNNVDKLIAIMSKRIQNQTENTFIQQYFEYNTTANIINEIIIFLRFRQVYINACITQQIWKSVSAKKKIEFGNNELKPFLELCIRLFIIPLEPVSIENMVYSPVTMERGSDLLIVILGETKPCLYIDKLGIMYISYLVNNISNTSKRISTVVVDPTISIYMYFYLHHIRKTTNKLHYAFTGPKDGKWRRSVKSIREYCTRIGINVHWLKLSPGHNYKYQSKLLWAFRQTYQCKTNKIIDTDTLSHFTYTTGISIATGQANQFYNAFKSMKKNEKALMYLKYILPSYSPIMVKLHDIPLDVITKLRNEMLNMVTCTNRHTKPITREELDEKSKTHLINLYAATFTKCPLSIPFNELRSMSKEKLITTFIQNSKSSIEK